MIICTLLALAVGYFVFFHATGQKGDVRSIGRVIGIIIMLISLIGAACGVACKASMACGPSGCKMMMKKSMCKL